MKIRDRIILSVVMLVSISLMIYGNFVIVKNLPLYEACIITTLIIAMWVAIPITFKLINSVIRELHYMYSKSKAEKQK